jgi:hypothetical protein
MGLRRWASFFAVSWMFACGGATFSGPEGASDGGSSGGGRSSSGAGSSSSGGTSSSGGAGSSSSGAGSSSGTNGSSSSSGSSSGTGSSSSSGAGSSGGGGSPACPATEPTSGAACPIVGAECEYGSDPSPSCNDLARCTTTGWNIVASGVCAPTMCPATYSDVPQGKSCTPVGKDCAYAEGQCNCADSLPISTGGPTWMCFSPKGCPEPRPRIGSACSQPSQTCDYGGCSQGASIACNDGYWQLQLVPCPAFTTPSHVSSGSAL